MEMINNSNIYAHKLIAVLERPVMSAESWHWSCARRGYLHYDKETVASLA